MKKRILLLLSVFFLSVVCANAQSMVSEIKWTDADYVTYNGLLILYPDNSGIFVVKFYHPTYGIVYCRQNARLTNQFDMYGNCISFINCSYPRVTPNLPYSADNFIVYPNGCMYTQDYSGKWSTLITHCVIQPQYWKAKYREYNI